MAGRTTRMALVAPIVGAAALLATMLDGARGGGARMVADTIKAEGAEIKIDLDKALAITIQDGTALRPVAFTTPDNRTGWGVKIPGGRPIATPAYADGMIFVGGGYGSYEFYAFAAATGELVWQIRTADDGPTAAVVEDGYVAFNTESCTVIVVEAKTGKIVWQEWLGDPLMSQPAISNGKLYIAYPSGGRSPRDVDATVNGGRGSHRMLCADLETGKHIWTYAISADVISAPVVDGDKLFFTCFDGTSYALDAASGALIWEKENAGTSAPTIAEGEVVMTTKQVDGERVMEGIQRIDLAKGNARDSVLLAAGEAHYLAKNKGGGVGLDHGTMQKLDESVGFSVAPSSAALDRANDHIGVSSVAGGWAYQGSRATYSRGRIMNAQGRYLNTIASADGKVAWRAEATGKNVDVMAQIFSPPAVGGRNLYLCTMQGHLMSVRQSDGALGFLYTTGHPATFQPALANGNMYVGTVDGWLICLKTGESDADGWYAWGGNAQHNKKN